ncbi:MAG: endo-1,4-beta-xylanase [Planctomycetota bacterium]
MLRFTVYKDGKAADAVDLSGAYAFGPDGVGLRAELCFDDGQISLIKRNPAAAGLALKWDAGDSGQFLLATTRLPDRDEPYHLNLELARGQMTRLAQKREDWGLFDFAEAADLNDEYGAVRDLFVEALKDADPVSAAEKADAALARGVTLGERMALFHAEAFLSRRRFTLTARPAFGCEVDLSQPSEQYATRLRDACDHVWIPTRWKRVEPKSHQYEYQQIDNWVNWAVRNKRRIHAGPLLSFDEGSLPEWLYIWEHDYDTLRDLIYEHIQRVVRRYKRHVRVWSVVSGLHCQTNFSFSFDQIMELTRMSCLLVKKLDPQAQVLIDLVTPWGEYYARNQRTIPPLLYADMAVQSGIKFDGFGVQIYQGVPVDGYYVRDLMQISTLLDEMVSMGKTIHISACQVPSDVSPDVWDAWNGAEPVAQAGQWHAPWSPRLQAEWLQAFSRVAISKPFVESICWRDLADYEGHYIPHGGLCRSDLEPKLAYREMRNFRASLVGRAAQEQQTPGQRP